MFPVVRRRRRLSKRNTLWYSCQSVSPVPIRNHVLPRLRKEEEHGYRQAEVEHHEAQEFEAVLDASGDAFDLGEAAEYGAGEGGRGDYYMHLADLASYTATQARVSALYADRAEWGRKAILIVALCGKFSSDRTIAEYAVSIWGATHLPIPGGTPITAATARATTAR
jgi:Carbohydrate phosphorylase